MLPLALLAVATTETPGVTTAPLTVPPIDTELLLFASTNLGANGAHANRSTNGLGCPSASGHVVLILRETTVHCVSAVAIRVRRSIESTTVEDEDTDDDAGDEGLL